MIALFYRKLIDVFSRLWDVLRLLPIRILRIGKHFGRGLWYLLPKSKTLKIPFYQHIKNTSTWLTILFFYLLDLFGICEFYEIFNDFIKYKTRPLTQEEMHLGKLIFGEKLNYRRVRIDNTAYIGPKQQRFAYVSFYTINFWGDMSPSLFLHELTHVWQYEKLGAAYIPLALQAQFSEEGYNYKGAKNLQFCMQQQGKLKDFNLEQQADIVADFYRLKTGKTPHWGNGKATDLPFYFYFIAQIT